jgi:hypothetical protein
MDESRLQIEGDFEQDFRPQTTAALKPIGAIKPDAKSCDLGLLRAQASCKG